MSTGRDFVTPTPGANRTAALSHLGFALIGIVNTMLGPLLPHLFVRWQLDDSRAGAVLLIQPASAMLASLASGLLIKRFGFTAPLACGFGLMAASTFLLGIGDRRVGVGAIAGTGISLGLTIPTINLLIAEVNAHRRAAAANVLNLVWGLGAAVGPLLISAFARAGSFVGALYFLGAWAAVMALLVSRGPSLLPPSPPGSAPAAAAAVTPDDSSAATIDRANLGVYLFLTGVLVFTNVGTESAVSGWVATYVQRLEGGASGFSWTLAPSAFGAGILIARAAAPLILRRATEKMITLAGTALAVGGLLVLLTSGTTTTALAGVGLTGLGLGPVFPTTFAVFTRRLSGGGAAAQMTGVLFLLAGLGAAVFPLVVGLVSARGGGLRAGLLVPLGGVALMLVLQIVIAALPRRS